MKAKKGTDFVTSIPDEGEHNARCIWIIDLGRQLRTWQGQEKEIDQIMFVFELPDSMDTFDPKKGPEPHVVSSEKFTNSLGSRANLRAFIEDWRGEKFINGNEDDFDLSSLVGKPCGIEIEHNVSKTNGRTYANIKRIICPKEKKNDKGKVVRAKREVAPLINRTITFEFGVSKKEVFDTIPGWIQNIIRSAVNYDEVAHIYGYEEKNQTANTGDDKSFAKSQQDDSDDEF